MANLVYFSSVSGNTHRFVEKLGVPADRIPIHGQLSHKQRLHNLSRRDTDSPFTVKKPVSPSLTATEPFVLVLPTYGGGTEGGAVPKQVITFLNDAENRSLIRGVIAAGNTNFGEAFCLAGDIVASKCTVPRLYRFEVFGTPDDVTAVHNGLEAFWTSQS
jgi:protein involved in ribonucleotide reduction